MLWAGKTIGPATALSAPAGNTTGSATAAEDLPSCGRLGMLLVGGQLGLEILDACSRGRLGILLVGGQLGLEILDACSRVYEWLLWLGLRQAEEGGWPTYRRKLGNLLKGASVGWSLF